MISTHAHNQSTPPSWKPQPWRSGPLPRWPMVPSRILTALRPRKNLRRPKMTLAFRRDLLGSART
eukprot:8183395-Pyramimonas_sp.AAC.1